MPEPDTLSAFHEVRFPMRLALGTSGGPRRRTDIVALSNGHETRNARWRDARRSYDAGSGMRSIADLYEVLAFFEARGGQLHGFRFRDPIDNQSAPPGIAATPFDQPIGTGDGTTREFQLVKTYADATGGRQRLITKPVAGTVLVGVSGAAISAFTLDPASGLVTLATAPASGAAITAGYAFDVPVRFDTDRLDINLSAFDAGAVPAIPLVEIKP
jgi:uncharacterized protein (TIGR02217 family)